MTGRLAAPDVPRRTVRRAGAVVTLALLIPAVGTQLPDAEQAPPTTSPPATGVLLGAYVQQRGSEDATAAIEALEATSDRKLDLDRVYLNWDDEVGSARVRGDIRRGRTPVLSVRPTRRDGTRLSWASIAAGTHDDAIAAQARAVAGLSAPVFVTFHHEPDQATGFGTPAEFTSAWRRYVTVFRNAGTTNASWTWMMTPSSFGSAPIGPGGDAFYPGDDVVDWIALDAYNWFGCAAGKPTSWRSLSTVIAPFMTWAARRDKPVMLAELGSVEDPADSERKATWIRDAARTFTTYPQVKAAIFFSAVGTCSWWLDSSAASSRGFAELAASAVTHGRTAAALEPSTALGPAPLTVTFDGSLSTGAGQPTGAGVASWTLDFGDGTTAATGSGAVPDAVAHTYSAGSYEAVLTVTDAAGGTAVDRRTVRAAGPPTVTGSESGITATTATLRAWVDPEGLPAQVSVEWGITTPVTSASSSRQQFELAAGSRTTLFEVPLRDLTPGERYYWRVVATSAGGTTTLPERRFDTPGPPTATTDAATSVRSSSALLNARVHPETLASKAWFEWGTTTAYGSTTPVVDVASATWPRPVSATITGLRSGRTYHFRIVATNSLGRGVGADRTFRTP
jgi:hypothetical protein